MAYNSFLCCIGIDQYSNNNINNHNNHYNYNNNNN